MATRNDIITLPHSALRKKSEAVLSVGDNLTQVINDMKSATLDWEDHREHEFGVALAAVQINKLLRVVVVRSDLDDKTNRDFEIYINPEITRFDGEPEVDLEGCLSVRDVYGKVPRYPKVKIKAMNERGEKLKFIAKGFKARLFQHEIDHTNGLTFADKIGSHGDFLQLKSNGEMVPLTGAEHKRLINELRIHGPTN